MSSNYTSPTEFLLTDLDSQVLTITLNRPEALNAFRPEMLEGIGKLPRCKQIPAPSVLLLGGHGHVVSFVHG